jgi:Holliday junction resolvasome RuvABC DNA-binding subunit
MTRNLTTVCGGHHGATPRGELKITGTAPNIVVTRTFEVPHVDDFDTPRAAQVPHVGATLARDAVLALTTLGDSKPEARRADDGALHEQPTTLEELVRSALRRCGTA